MHKLQYEEMGFAKPDIGRLSRTGFSEVVFCERKPDAYLTAIFEKLLEANGEIGRAHV